MIASQTVIEFTAQYFLNFHILLKASWCISNLKPSIIKGVHNFIFVLKLNEISLLSSAYSNSEWMYSDLIRRFLKILVKFCGNCDWNLLLRQRWLHIIALSACLVKQKCRLKGTNSAGNCTALIMSNFRIKTLPRQSLLALRKQRIAARGNLLSKFYLCNEYSTLQNQAPIATTYCLHHLLQIKSYFEPMLFYFNILLFLSIVFSSIFKILKKFTLNFSSLTLWSSITDVY